MTDPNAAFAQRLRAIFAEEAREHLAHIDASLVALEQASGPARAPLVEAVLKSLHTLKGAARAVDLGELERLCHALEGVFAALDQGAALAAEQFDRIHQAAAVARQLIDAPGGRARNQAQALAGQLEALAAQVVVANAPAPPPGATAPVPAAPAQPVAAQPAPAIPAAPAPPAPEVLEPHRGELVRVQGRSLDAIRAHAESLLPVELQLRHQVDALRQLAAGMGALRRDPGAANGAGPDSAAFELDCMRLAADLASTGAQLAAARARLMDAALETALVPFSGALEELPALVRKLARARGKEVRLATRGDSVAVDRRVLGVIREALMHLVTNAVDHAIEQPAVRAAAGKPREGHIQVAVAQRDGRRVAIRVSDDGAGIDVDAVVAAALRQGRLDSEQLAGMNERQRLQLALRAGISTRTEVTEVSGRGMGLAIVAGKVAAAGGELLIENAPGAGCAFEFVLPVGVASVRALVVQAGAQRYAVPLAGLDAVRAVAAGDIRTVEGRETVLAGGAVLPLVRLAALFGSVGAQAVPDSGVALVARAAAGHGFALLADAIVAEQDLLPKGLGSMLPKVRYVSGAAQLGDGALVPLVALEDIGAHGLRADAPAAPEGEAAAGAGRVLVVEDSITSRLLLKHILEGAGCSVETAVDGLDALSKLRAARFDAVVSDVEMPNMDGLALTESIRANPKTAELPVILVTSLQTPQERERGLRAGADAYFTKGSFDQDRLLATVRRVAGMGDA